jgi:HK97 gp10 family phage protein
MGLKAVVSVNSLGFPSYTPTLHIPVDYSDAMDLFCEIFLDTAQDLVPVDTGALMNSIDVDYNENWTATCVATMPYAQYVEYGTYKMNAQPFFEPAIQAALDEALPELQNALDEALEEEQEILEQQMENSEEGAEMDGGGGGLLGIAAMFVALAAFTILKEMFSSMFLNRRKGGTNNKFATLLRRTLVNVEIEDF